MIVSEPAVRVVPEAGAAEPSLGRGVSRGRLGGGRLGGLRRSLVAGQLGLELGEQLLDRGQPAGSRTTTAESPGRSGRAVIPATLFLPFFFFFFFFFSLGVAAG